MIIVSLKMMDKLNVWNLTLKQKTHQMKILGTQKAEVKSGSANKLGKRFKTRNAQGTNTEYEVNCIVHISKLKYGYRVKIEQRKYSHEQRSTEEYRKDSKIFFENIETEQKKQQTERYEVSPQNYPRR
ncbi:hypothetical protein CHS0354_040260 [Potamilus streckersoni]|uniref:Uncharacterized protein n=1 Tax=Potamilus streckersoni TaxID=2493646 RepID=A0AAE0S4X9_9BIVA|nr:hypothetical protein CHS0354_040260 [Potamilus streckersoni]